MSVPHEIGARVRAIRERKGMKQMSLARALQIPAQTLSNYENGPNKVPSELVSDIAAALGVTIGELYADGFEDRDRAEIPMPSSQNVRMPIEDTLAAVLDQLQQMNTLLGLVLGAGAQRGGGSSSVTIEDMSKGRPKITTKRYTGSEPEIAQAIDDHALAVRYADEAWKADWKATHEVLVKDALLEAAAAHGASQPLEPLSEMGPLDPFPFDRHQDPSRL